VSGLLLSEELALLAMKPGRGRHAIGNRYALNACLAGLLVAELGLSDRASGPSSATLSAAAGVVAEHGPALRSILSGMDRGLRRQTGRGTWDLVTAGLRDDDGPRRGEIVERLRSAASATDAVDDRTALLLGFCGLAKLLEVVAPRRRGRRDVRRRIDHVLDGSPFEAIRAQARRLIVEQESVGATAATAAVIAGGAG
jgi:hypothetical protein